MLKITVLNVVVLLVAASAFGLPQVREVPFPYRTIQEAIEAANDGDTIIVHPGTYTDQGNRDIDFLGKAITVRSEDPEDADVVAATVIDCQGSGENPHRAFILQTFEDANSIIDGFTIMNGYVRADGAGPGEGETDGGDGENEYGGAINCTGTSPIIRNCVINNCIAEGGKGGNGAPGEPGIPEDPGDPNDPNDDIPAVPPTEGGAGGAGGGAYGGAIYCDPNSGPIILNCRISNCSALAGQGGEGGTGGIGSDANEPNAPDGPSGASGAEGDGGGVYSATGSIATVIECIFIDCNATAGGGEGEGGSRGGALYYGAGYTGAFTGDITSCSADYGAGIYCDANTTFELNGNSITGGSGRFGVGVYCDANCVLTMDDCLVANGTGDSGAGVYCGIDCVLTISDSNILNHTASGDGAGLFCDTNSVLTLKNCNIIENTAEGTGGAIFCGSEAVVSLNNCNITQSTTTGAGGAIYCGDDTELDVNDCMITGNTAGGDGGAICYGSGGTITLDQCDLSNNTSHSGFGGAIYGGQAVAQEVDTQVVITDSVINNNAAQYGGGICLAGTNTALSDTSVSGNTAERGGGAFWHKSEISIENCTVNDNSANTGDFGSGGGLYCLDSSLIIIDSTVIGNTTISFGGGVYVDGPNMPGGSQEFFNCLIVNNTTERDGGGVACNEDADVKMTNCTIAGNQVLNTNGRGGGISCYASKAEIVNTILWGNSAQHGAQIAIGDPFEPYNPLASVKLIYSDLQGGEQDVYVCTECTLNLDLTNIASDPLFDGGHHLRQIMAGDMVDSPCLDAGSDSARTLRMNKYYSTRTDDVPDANIVDMGYHYSVVPGTCDCDLDGDVDMDDLVIVFSYWLEGQCDQIDDCSGADSNFDTDVNFVDYAICLQFYVAPDSTPPTPDPSRWREQPYAITDSNSGSVSAIGMAARAASDQSGVAYLFECNDVNAGILTFSEWQDSPAYTYTELSGSSTYVFRVKARDRSPKKNETGWSEPASIVFDLTPPTPNPSEWEIPPFEYQNQTDSKYYHAMRAIEATDPAGVEYEFFCVDTGISSGWLDNPQYFIQVIQPYSYRSYKVRTRDKAPHRNEGEYSEPEIAWPR